MAESTSVKVFIGIETFEVSKGLSSAPMDQAFAIRVYEAKLAELVEPSRGDECWV